MAQGWRGVEGGLKGGLLTSLQATLAEVAAGGVVTIRIGYITKRCYVKNSLCPCTLFINIKSLIVLEKRNFFVIGPLKECEERIELMRCRTE